VEQHDALATEASGNTQGALYTKLSANNAPLTQFGLSSLQYATRHYQQAFLQTVFERCGVLQLTDNKDETLQSLFQHNQDYLQWLDVDAASTIAGVTVAEGGWWLPHTGWLAPRAVCAALVQHGNITVLHQRADTLMQVGEHWQVYLSNEKKSLEADHIVIACANSSKQFAQTEWLPLRPVRGQISLLPATPLSRHLRCVVCAEGYLAPAHLGQHCLGASFVPGDTSTAVRDTEHTHNIGLLTAISPVLHTEWLAASEGRAGVRTTAADHLPLVGAMPDREAFLNNYATLRHNAKAVIASPGSYVSGLSLFTAFGGRGLCYIPLAAELLCSQLLQQPRPVSRELQMALAPARCVVRELIRTHAGR
jgi:tRNA 5-methylaminomethyl-2-thiouridine biosynthesis bifunctional protein